MTRFCGLCVVAFLMLGTVVSAEPVPAQERPIEISSRQLQADQASGRTRFSGEVVVAQGDLTLYADEVVFVSNLETNQLERVEAQGAVRVVQGERSAVGQRAVFYNSQRKIELFGGARIQQGEDLVEGEHVIIYLDEKRSEVKGGDDGRVKAIFQPKGDTP